MSLFLTWVVDRGVECWGWGGGGGAGIGQRQKLGVGWFIEPQMKGGWSRDNLAGGRGASG